jgi:hypothetical protein
MDTIAFEKRPYIDGSRDGGIRIFLNGRDLVDLLRKTELPFAHREGAESIAGAYSGLPPGPDTCPPSKHFLGDPSWEIYRYGNKTQVLGCECGEPGCWPLVCRITIDGAVVRWTEFEQPHRSGENSLPAWSYDAFGPFQFDRQQYEAAVQQLGEAG